MAAFIQTRLCFRRTADFETKPKRAPIVSSIYHCCDGLWNLLYGQPVEFTDMKIRFVFLCKIANMSTVHVRYSEQRFPGKCELIRARNFVHEMFNCFLGGIPITKLYYIFIS